MKANAAARLARQFCKLSDASRELALSEMLRNGRHNDQYQIMVRERQRFEELLREYQGEGVPGTSKPPRISDRQLDVAINEAIASGSHCARAAMRSLLSGREITAG
jgi:hypothetical protein